MKKLILLSTLMLIVICSFSQQRLVLIERFTGASCPPCAVHNATVEELMSFNTDKAVSLVYQSNLVGDDPMYYDYPTGTNSRSSYYGGLNSIPQFVADGNFEGPTIMSDFTQSDIDTRSAVPSPFNIDLSFTKTATQIDVAMDITAVASVSGNLKARIAVIEDRIAFDNAPGSNGEKYFIKVLKQFLPSPSGTTLSTEWAIDDTFEINQSWTFENVYDHNEIAVIAFIQDDNTKEIHQVAFAKPVIENDFDLKITAVNEIPAQLNLCNTEPIIPRLTIVNNGTEPITNFDIEYNINEEEPLTYSWTGNLSNHLDYAIVHLPEIVVNSFQNYNEFTSVLKNINGNTTDDNPENNTFVEEFTSFRVSNDLQIRFRSGGYGTNFAWRIVSEGAASVPSEYANTLSLSYDGADTNIVDINLPYDCWMFKIYKSNGVNPVSNFFFEIIDRGNVVYRTTSIPKYTDILFYIDESINVREVEEFDNGIKVYPNPAKDLVCLDLSEFKGKDYRVKIYNINGVSIYENNLATDKLYVDMSSKPKGLYFINISGDGINKVEKFILQ